MPIRLARAVVALMGALAVSACSVFGSAAAPEPEFTTIRNDAPFEVRAYPELVLVRTPMSGGSRGAFGRLFDYISGANNGTRKIDMTAPVLESGKGEKIAMTAPVLRDGTDDGVEEMAFILPAGFSAETAPLPTDPSVTLDVIPPRRVAVISFSGRATEADFDQNRLKLEEWIAGRGLVATGPAELAQYNPPWTIPSMRRNEVLIPVAER